MSLTTDPTDPKLGKWKGEPEDKPTAQDEVYLVLSDVELAKGFVRPFRDTYRHVGTAGPKFPLKDVTDEDRERFSWGKGPDDFIKFEEYPENYKGSSTGRYWSQNDLDAVGKGCGQITHMGMKLSETYARNPHFYGATYCCSCMKHFAVGEMGEFIWEGTNERVGT